MDFVVDELRNRLEDIDALGDIVVTTIEQVFTAIGWQIFVRSKDDVERDIALGRSPAQCATQIIRLGVPVPRRRRQSCEMKTNDFGYFRHELLLNLKLETMPYIP